jgi:hypothetical protein
LARAFLALEAHSGEGQTKSTPNQNVWGTGKKPKSLMNNE